MQRTPDSGLFWNITFGGGPKKSHLKDLDLIFSQRNMNLCLQRVNAYLRAAWNPHKSEPLNVSSDPLPESRRKGRRAARGQAARLSVPLIPQPSLPPGHDPSITAQSAPRLVPCTKDGLYFLLLLPCYYARQLLVHEFLHTLVLRGIAEKPPERLNVSAVVSKQAPHGRCHFWFSERQRGKGRLTSFLSLPSSFFLSSPPPGSSQKKQTPQQACFELKVLARLGVQKLILSQYLYKTLSLRLHLGTVILEEKEVVNAEQ